MIYDLYILWLIPTEFQTVDSNANGDSNSKQWVLLRFPSLYSMDYYWSGTVVHRRNKYTEMHLLAIQLYMTCSYPWKKIPMKIQKNSNNQRLQPKLFPSFMSFFSVSICSEYMPEFRTACFCFHITYFVYGSTSLGLLSYTKQYV